jgi:hypothetical protein
MEFMLDLAVRFWMFTTVFVLIIIGFVVNLFGVDNDKVLVNFKYKDMPHMKPVRIATAGKGFWGAIKMWLLGGRTWEIVKDWHYSLDGVNYVVPKGFVFDGASVPKFLASWLSPVGVLLVGGLVHDYGYKYETLYTKNKGDWKENCGWKTQKDMDIIFRDINIEQNGFHFLNYLAYWALRLGGFAAWNGHRKRNCKIGE